MAFEQKPGFGSLFQNKKKKSDKEPTMRGEVMTPDGRLLEIAGWSKTDKNGGKYLSLKVQEPRAKDGAAPAKASKAATTPLDDAVPF